MKQNQKNPGFCVDEHIQSVCFIIHSPVGRAGSSLSRASNEELQANDHSISHMQSISIWKQVIKPKEIIIDL